MLNKKEMFEQINFYLSHLKVYIEMENTNGSFDINKYCEDFIAELLNLVFGLELENLNLLSMNFPTVDLADDDACICFQVTSSRGAKKIRDTLDKFKEKKLYKKYQSIRFFILGDKKNYSSGFKYKEFEFNKDRDILDFTDLSNEIRRIKDIKKLNEILDLLRKNVKSVEPKKRISMLDGIENIKLHKGKSYRKLIVDFYGDKIESEEANVIINDIEYFGKQLLDLNRNTREVIFAITKKYHKLKDTVLFNKHEVARFLNTSDNRLYNEINILMQRGFVEVIEETGDDYDELKFYDKNKDWEILSSLIKFCNKYKRDIGKILLDLDLTILD